MKSKQDRHSRAREVLLQFRGFILRGNVVDLAVAVSIGAAFTAVLAALTASFITPLIGAIFGKSTTFESLQFTINGSVFAYGRFINALITFFITGAVLFFFVVKPVGHLLIRLGIAPAVPQEKANCPACLTEIPIGASRCAFCTTELGAGWTPEAEI